MEFDVRHTAEAVVSRIRFGEDQHPYDGSYTASTLETSDSYTGRVLIKDHGDHFVLIHDAQHARYLIQALDKAVKLGWLK